LGSGSTVNCWIVTTTRIYYVTDITNVSSRSVTSQHIFAASCNFRTIQTERGTQDWVVVASSYPAAGVKACYTTNGGTTWTEVTVASGTLSGSVPFNPDDYDWAYEFDFINNSPDSYGWSLGSVSFCGGPCEWEDGVGVKSVYCSGLIGKREFLHVYTYGMADAETVFEYVSIQYQKNVALTANDTNLRVSDQFTGEVDFGLTPTNYAADEPFYEWTGSEAFSSQESSPGSQFEVSIYYNVDSDPPGYDILEKLWVAGSGEDPFQEGAGDVPAGGDPANPTVYVSGKTPGLVYIGGANNGVGDLYVSTDYGATWALASAPDHDFGDYFGGMFHFPWHDNDDENVYYYGNLTNDALSLYRTSEDGTTSTEITPTGDYGPNEKKCIATSPVARNYVALCGTDQSTGNIAIFRSADHGTTWTTLLSAAARADTYVGVHIADDPDVMYFWGPAGVAYSPNGGATIYDRTGNANSSEVVGIGGW